MTAKRRHWLQYNTWTRRSRERATERSKERERAQRERERERLVQSRLTRCIRHVSTLFVANVLVYPYTMPTLLYLVDNVSPLLPQPHVHPHVLQ